MPSVPSTRERASDATLVLRMAAGDARALAELYDAHGRAAFALAAAIAGDRSRAEGAVAAGFADAWHGAAAFRAERTSVRAWLLLLVRRHALTERTARRAFSAASLGASAALPAAPLAALDEDDRKALELAYYGGLSVREIALALEQSEAGILRRLRGGIQTLRRATPPMAPMPAPHRATHA